MPKRPLSNSRRTRSVANSAAGPIGDSPVLTLENQLLPATLNLDNQDPTIELDIVAGHARSQPIQYALSNSIGFGGHNVASAFGRA